MGTSTQGIGWPDELVDALVAGGRQVIRFDHRDTGRSTCADFATRPYARLAPLSKITAPALVIHGTADPLRSLPHGQALAAQIPHARLKAVPGMGHGLFSPGQPRHIGQMILGHTQSPPSGTLTAAHRRPFHRIA
jgi:pimeloyl-ACP methyl ester carboxylesterase